MAKPFPQLEKGYCEECRSFKFYVENGICAQCKDKAKYGLFGLFIQIIQTALDELEVDPEDITEVEIEPHWEKSYWLNFNDAQYYACVNKVYGELSVWLAGSYPLPEQL